MIKLMANDDCGIKEWKEFYVNTGEQHLVFYLEDGKVQMEGLPYDPQYDINNWIMYTHVADISELTQYPDFLMAISRYL